MKTFQLINVCFSPVLYVLQREAALLNIGECDTEKCILQFLLVEYAK